MARISLQLLSEQEKDKIHTASLDILDRVGLRVLDPEARRILAGVGARVDESTLRVCFPAALIEQALRLAPHELTLYGREADQAPVHLRPGNVFYSTSGYAVHWHDAETGIRQPVTQASLAQLTQIADGLDQMDIYSVVGTPADAPARTNDRYQLAISLINTTKHIWNTAYGREGVRDAAAMASIVRGSEQALRQFPLLTLDMTTLSPLELDARQTGAMIEGARQGIPIAISPGPIGGATGPVTLAGNITQANAEVLGAIALCQVVQPGIPVVYTQWSRSLDMSSGRLAMGGPEFSLQRIATAEMARYYNLPSRGGGLMADAKAADAQMGAEKMHNCLLASLAGLNIVAGIGMVDITNTISPVQMLIDNEMISLVRRILGGFAVDEDTIPLALIGEVSRGGDYLTAEHTLRHFRQELWFTKPWDRKPWSEWQKEGATDIAERARARLHSSRHTVPALDRQMTREIWRVVHAADRATA